MSTFLENIVAHKRRELARHREALPERELERLAQQAPPVRVVSSQFSVARGTVETPPGRSLTTAYWLLSTGLGVIAEIKRSSPSRGAIAPRLDAVDQARRYAEGGADAISVLTDSEFYGGSLDDLRAVRAATSLPLMRKDFILDRYGVLEARAAGADVVLLIVAVLEPEDASGDVPAKGMLVYLMAEVVALGMAPLVEVSTEREAMLALDAGAALVGINNRDLRTFDVSLETTERLAPLLAPHATVVSLSGIKDAADAERVVAAGARAVLVGEALMRSGDPAACIADLKRVRVPARALLAEG